MAPKTVFVIRHCDKPSDDDTDDGNCNPDGYKRGLLLAGVKGKCEPKDSKSFDCNVSDCDVTSAGTDFWSSLLDGEKPTALLAAVSKKDKNGKSSCTTSNRCCLVLNPTAKRYGMKINDNEKVFCDDKGSDIADYILKTYKKNDIIIVAWEHKNIPELINALGVSPKLDKWPKTPNDRFDLVFKVDFSKDTKNPSLTIITQNLNPSLPGDSNVEPFGYNNKKNNALRNTSNTSNNKKKSLTKFFLIGMSLFIFILCLFYWLMKSRNRYR